MNINFKIFCQQYNNWKNKIVILNDVQQNAANDVYEILTSDNKKIYLPAIHEVIKKVDIKNKKMYVEIMKGLI